MNSATVQKASRSKSSAVRTEQTATLFNFIEYPIIYNYQCSWHYKLNGHSGKQSWHLLEVQDTVHQTNSKDLFNFCQKSIQFHSKLRHKLFMTFPSCPEAYLWNNLCLAPVFWKVSKLPDTPPALPIAPRPGGENQWWLLLVWYLNMIDTCHVWSGILTKYVLERLPPSQWREAFALRLLTWRYVLTPAICTDKTRQNRFHYRFPVCLACRLHSKPCPRNMGSFGAWHRPSPLQEPRGHRISALGDLVWVQRTNKGSC